MSVVTKFLRYGYHQAPTTPVLTFDEPLDAARAQDSNNYRIVGPDGRLIKVDSATYDPATLTVSVSPRERPDVHRRYTLIVIGRGAAGVAGADGLLLEGARTGQPGSNYLTAVTFANLVLGARAPVHPSVTTLPSGVRKVPVVLPHRAASIAPRKSPAPRLNVVNQVHRGHPTASAVDHALASVGPRSPSVSADALTGTLARCLPALRVRDNPALPATAALTSRPRRLN